MKVDLSKEIKTLDGEPITVDGKVATIGSLASKSLMNSSSENYLEKVDLAKELLEDLTAEITLTTGKVEVIKKAVKEMRFTAQIVYQFEQAIDPTEEDSKEKPKDKK